MAPHTETRRRVLQALGLGLVAALGGCTRSQQDAAGVTATPTETAAETGRGTTVEIVASYPEQDADTASQRRSTVLTDADFATISPAQPGGGGRPPHVQVTLTEAAAARYTAAMQEFGFTSETGTSACRYQEQPDTPGYCLHTVIDGEIVYSASMSPALAETIASGEFSEQPAFILATENESQAEALERKLSG